MPIKISALPDAGALTGAETIPLVQTSTTKKTLFSSLADWCLQTYAGFTQSGTGAVARTVQGRLRAQKFVSDFGTLGAGNDAAIFQAAVTAVQGTVYELVVDALLQLGTTSISVTDSLHLRAGNEAQAGFQWTGTTMVALDVATPNIFTCEGLYFIAPASCTGGAGIKLSGSGGVANFRSSISNCNFYQCYVGVDTQSAYGWRIRECYFNGFVQFGVNVHNSIAADAGDSLIDGNCIFANAASAVACVNHVTSGGLKIIGNKFNTGQYSYRMQLAGDTSDLVFCGNSCENFSVAAMGFFRTSGSFNNISIAGNQIALGVAGILMNDAAAFFSTVTISGNVMTALTQYGIIVSNADDVTISGNTIIGTGGSTVAGIYLDTGVTGLAMGVNKVRGFATLIADLSTDGNITKFDRPILTYSGGTAAPLNTSENILATGKIPAGALGLTGALRIFLSFVLTNNANAKTLRVRLGGISGSVIWSQAAANAGVCRADISCGNTGTASSNVSTAMTQLDATMQTAAAVTTTVDTSVALTLVVTCEKASGADNIVLNSAIATLLG